MIRASAALLVAAVLALAWLERRSPQGQALREGRPCVFCFELDSGPAPKTRSLFAAVFHPRQRTLDLIYLPQTSARTKGRHSETPEELLSRLVPAWKDGSGLPLWEAQVPTLSDEPPLDARDWILRHGLLHFKSSWLHFDRLVLALEINRLRPQDVRPAWLPPESVAGPFLERRLLSQSEETGVDHPAVEVLNATPNPGIASRAKNMLRFKGADVMSVGNAVGVQRRTLVYDRTGQFENAASVLRMLGCPAAQALTRVDFKRIVDVTVVLAADCPLPSKEVGHGTD